MKNNRSLADRRMNELDHAIGRPDCAMSSDGSDRNFFGVEIGSTKAAEMIADPYWTHTRDFMGTSGFMVSSLGRKALGDYLKNNWTPPRRYRVEYEYGDGLLTDQVVEADTRAKARYMAWDGDYHGPFKEFLGCIRSVRVYRREENE